MISGYYLTTVSGLVSFPVARRYGGEGNHVERTDLVHETDRGRRWVYAQFDRRIFNLTFRVTEAQLATFTTLDTAVDGQRTAFYFVPDVTVPGTAIYVRKEKDFKPRELEGKASSAGVATKMFDYMLQLTEEPTGDEVEE